MTPLPVKVPEHNLGIDKIKRELYIVVKSIVQFVLKKIFGKEKLKLEHENHSQTITGIIIKFKLDLCI
jgi:hypothetical protein